MRLKVGIMLCIGMSFWGVSGEAALTKRRLCVEYVVENTRHNETILSVFDNVTGSECLQRCAHHPGCNAYNLLRKEGVCEILRGLGVCGETKDRTWAFEYIHLQTCKGQLPWLRRMMNWTRGASCQTWYRTEARPRSRCPTGMVTAPDGWACVALIPTKGLYLPGWYHSYYRVIMEDGQPMWCSDYGYILRAVPECPVSWQTYTVGDPLPSAAVTVSTWKDGTPLYFVSNLIQSKWYIGYLLPSVPRSYVLAGIAHSPTDVHILVYV